METKKQKTKERETKNMSADFNRLSFDAISNLSTAMYDVMKQLEAGGDACDAIMKSELYCALWPLSVMSCNHYIKRVKAKAQYEGMNMQDLLKQLYLRMQTYFHYGECKGRELPGIACHMEQSGVFAIDLRGCAINMECEIQDGLKEEKGKLFCIGLNLPLLEEEDPENPESRLVDEYDKFVSFCCDFGEGGGCRDVYPSPTYSNEQAICNILAGMDLISEMNNEQKVKK